MKRNRILAALSVLANCDRAKYPLGMSRGEIRTLAGLPADTEVCRPVRDLRKVPYELNVITTETKENGERVWRYRLHVDDIDRARKILAEHYTVQLPSHLQRVADESWKAYKAPAVNSPKCQTARHDLMPRACPSCAFDEHVLCVECRHCYTCNEASMEARAV